MAKIDFEACMRYVRGESSLEEAKAVRAWLKEPANELVAQHWMSQYMASLEINEQADPVPFDYAGMQGSLGSRLGFDEPAVAMRSPPAWRRWAAAAALVGVAAGAGGRLYWQHAQPGASATQAVAATAPAAAPVQYATGNGQTREVQLPDGSTVTLNANSTLRYAANWSPAAPREVWLNGEAYFSVKHLPNHQRFRVHTSGNFNVEVLGTKFTVYRRHEQERVVLLSGKVRVDFHDRSQPDVILKPGELLQTADTTPKQVVHKAVRAPAYAAWKDSRLVLDDLPITELATRLHDTYGVEVVVKDSALSRQTITGTVPLGDLNLLCQALQASFNIKVERRAQRILLSPR
jgi:ferric-dicitrate binding protein FerR (iron transport regulator)